MPASVVKLYSNCFFETVKENNILDVSYEEIRFLKGLFSDNYEYINLLSSPVIDYNKKENILDELLSGKISGYTLNFLKVLLRNKRITYFFDICDLFIELYNNEKNIIEVKVITAVNLEEVLKNKLKDKLELITKKNILIKIEIRTDIIGGIIIELGNVKIDSSIKAKIEGLKRDIKNIVI